MREWLSIKQIADEGLILNTKGRRDYYFIYDLVRDGKLRAADWSRKNAKNTYYMIHRDWVLEYKRGLKNQLSKRR